jgi:hypothetical protein
MCPGLRLLTTLVSRSSGVGEPHCRREAAQSGPVGHRVRPERDERAGCAWHGQSLRPPTCLHSPATTRCRSPCRTGGEHSPTRPSLQKKGRAPGEAAPSSRSSYGLKPLAATTPQLRCNPGTPGQCTAAAAGCWAEARLPMPNQPLRASSMRLAQSCQCASYARSPFKFRLWCRPTSKRAPVGRWR